MRIGFRRKADECVQFLATIERNRRIELEKKLAAFDKDLAEIRMDLSEIWKDDKNYEKKCVEFVKKWQKRMHEEH